MKQKQKTDSFENMSDQQTQNPLTLRIKSTRGLRAFVQLTVGKGDGYIFAYHNTYTKQIQAYSLLIFEYLDKSIIYHKILIQNWHMKWGLKQAQSLHCKNNIYREIAFCKESHAVDFKNLSECICRIKNLVFSLILDFHKYCISCKTVFTT